MEWIRGSGWLLQRLEIVPGLESWQRVLTDSRCVNYRFGNCIPASRPAASTWQPPTKTASQSTSHIKLPWRIGGSSRSNAQPHHVTTQKSKTYRGRN